MRLENKKNAIFLTIILIFSSCNNLEKQKIDSKEPKLYLEIKKANWILGDWQNESQEGIVKESWRIENDSTFIGSSSFVIGEDTVSSESLLLEQKGQHLFYIPTVKNENNGQSVKFILTNTSENQLIFENPKHDFPQKIVYSKLNNDSIVAEISGLMEGKPNSISYPLSRIKK